MPPGLGAVGRLDTFGDPEAALGASISRAQAAPVVVRSAESSGSRGTPSQVGGFFPPSGSGSLSRSRSVSFAE